MFRRTDSQATFGSLNVLLSPKKIAKLEKKHGAGGFRRKALPVLLANEETFWPLFCEDNGRPNKPVATTLGVIILKEMFDLTDEVALDNFEFNNAWQYALHVEPDGRWAKRPCNKERTERIAGTHGWTPSDAGVVHGRVVARHGEVMVPAS